MNKEVHIKTYDEWLKYYENATKEQVIEDLTRDVQYFADAVKDIKDLQQELDKYKNIVNELEKYIEKHFVGTIATNILEKLKELKGSDN